MEKDCMKVLRWTDKDTADMCKETATEISQTNDGTFMYWCKEHAPTEESHLSEIDQSQTRYTVEVCDTAYEAWCEITRYRKIKGIPAEVEDHLDWKDLTHQLKADPKPTNYDEAMAYAIKWIEHDMKLRSQLLHNALVVTLRKKIENEKTD